MFLFHPFPILTTVDLLLRQMAAKDTRAHFELRAHEEVNRYLDSFRHRNMDETRLFMQKVQQGIDRNEWIYWTIALRTSDEFIGTICLWNFSHSANDAEVGYTLHPAWQYKGYMRQALHAVLDFAFTSLLLDRVSALTHCENERSIHLLKSFRFDLLQNEDNPLLCRYSVSKELFLNNAPSGD